MFRLGVVTDSHHRRDMLEKAAQQLADVDAIAHLGDNLRDADTLYEMTGKPVYAVVEVTIKNTEDTKTSQAFDLEACVQALHDKMNAPKKVSLKKEADPEAEAKRAKREEQKHALHAWLTENLTEQMTTTDIQNACPDMDGISVMQVGSWLTAIAKDDPSIQRDVVKGKPYYSKV